MPIKLHKASYRIVVLVHLLIDVCRVPYNIHGNIASSSTRIATASEFERDFHFFKDICQYETQALNADIGGIGLRQRNYLTMIPDALLIARLGLHYVLDASWYCCIGICYAQAG